MLEIRQEQLDALRAAARAAGQNRFSPPGAPAERDPDTGDLLSTDRRGHVTRLSFAADGLPGAVRRPSGAEMRFEHDRDGRMSAITYPGGERIEMRRDGAGNVTEISRPGLLTYRLAYGVGDRLSGVKDPNGTVTRLAYDEAGRLTSVTDRAGATTRFILDASGRREAVIDPLGRRTSYETDASGALAGIVFPDGSRESHGYDPDLNAAVLTRRDGSEVAYRLSEAGSIEAIHFPDNTVHAFAFDRDGNLLGAHSDAEGVRYSLDPDGNPLLEATSAGRVSYTYDPEGRLVGLTTPFGDHLGYAYDEDGRISRIVDWEGRETAFSYAPDGTVAAVRYGNGLVEAQTYARVGRLSRAVVTDALGSTLSEQTYDYDLLERLTRVSDGDGRRGAPRAVRLAYDAESRLVREADEAGEPVAFAYDAAGNLVAIAGDPIPVGAMDEPLAAFGAPIEYDALGNMRRFRTPEGEIRCSFGADGTLRQVEACGRTTRFAYDALGRRIAKSDGTAAWRYGWAGHQLLWEEVRADARAAPVRRDYLFVPDSTTPIAFREAGRTYWLQSDARGAIIRAFDEVGRVAWHATYDAFGLAQVHVARVRQPFRLVGHYADEETGLHYNHARYYSPRLRSYISCDPNWANPAATNYSYARNDPWNRADPFGAVAPLLLAAGAIAVAGVVGAATSAAVAYAAGEDPVAAAVEGGLTGAGAAAGVIVAGMVGASAGILVAGAMLGAAAGALVNALANQARKGEELCLPCAAQAAGISLGTDLALLGLGRIPGVKKLAQIAGKRLSAHFPRVTSRLKIAGKELHKAGRPLRDWAGRKIAEAGRNGMLLMARLQMGMSGRAVESALKLAKEFDAVIKIRPANNPRPGHPPKPEHLKMKTIKSEDIELGAPEGSEGLVGFFKPKDPGPDRPDLAKRYKERMK
ncbi:MAG TPA: RHS repeat-associated core domain-containing protein [Microvirga sp.]|jgi:RHS repeat-associated protein|nr:RHS repeat-associated core domain-containing protein [Microvirga sp.]